MRRLSSAAMLLVLLAAGLVTSRSLEAQGTRLCFNVPGISNCIESRFRQYWEQNGGLAVFGYPISAAQNERNRDTGHTYLTHRF